MPGPTPYPCSCCGGIVATDSIGLSYSDYCTDCRECDGTCDPITAATPFCCNCGSAALADGHCKYCVNLEVE
jgi:hypothetical protein